MNRPELNEHINLRDAGNRRLKKAPLSLSATALIGCGTLLTIGAALVGAVLIFLGWVKAGIAAAALVILSTTIRTKGKLRESSIRALRQAEQNKRDAKARDIVERLGKNVPIERPLLVYLRPSATETRFSWCIGMLGTWSMKMAENSYPYTSSFCRRDFEGVIARIAEPLGDLVTVGGEEDVVGGGRIDSGSDGWPEIVESLCSAASVIFILPLRKSDKKHEHDGITTEVQLLMDRPYLRKTVFIMPPAIVEDMPDYFLLRLFATQNPEYRRTADRRLTFVNLAVEDCWSAAREHFSNLALPPFRDRGLAFYFSDDGAQVHEICELTSFLPRLCELGEWMRTRQSEIIEWMRTHQRWPGPLIDEVREKWGDDTWDDPRTVQIWPLLSHLLSLVKSH